ncbi:MAG: DNA helicase RecG, partial [Chloroflexales bacterium]|nr:DNA helicase RecG [Chloroflexales bacterium]
MQDREHIIRLGKVLASEYRRGCDDGAVDGGLAHFLSLWRAEAGADLVEPAVLRALDLLAGYGAQSILERRDRVGQALEGLRAIFRVAPDAG